jgi:hypothetical protein
VKRNRAGMAYALATACLYATQEPLSFLGAKELPVLEFILFTQVALFLSLPLLLARASSRRDFVSVFRERASYPRLGVILAITAVGLVLYNVGLGGSHPVIISATLGLAPFWKVSIPGSILVFFGCLAGAVVGAVAVAWSQSVGADGEGASAVVDTLRKGSWMFAVPVPICTTLAATLVGKWFSKYDESGTIAANFVAANAVMIPATILGLYWRSEFVFADTSAIVLLVIGTITAASIGRVFYQIALSATGEDNGFVSMFLNLVPALSALLSFLLSFWIADLRFRANWLYFGGLLLIAASLFVFSLKSAPTSGTNKASH